MDLAELLALRPIDIHVHPGTQEYIDTHGEAQAEVERYFKRKARVWTESEMAEAYSKDGIRGVLLAFDAETATGAPRTSNDYVARVAKEHSTAFPWSFASVDPWKGKAALVELERSARALGMRGAKFHPPVQAFYPNDGRFDELWDTCVQLDLPVLFHSGMTAWPGVRMEYARPIPYLDDLALRFPRLVVISAHPAFPWVDEQIALAIARPNVHIDLSGHAPRYFPPQLVREIKSRLQDKVLFGSDFPSLAPERWLTEFAALDLPPAVVAKVIHGNAAALLRVDD